MSQPNLDSRHDENPPRQVGVGSREGEQRATEGKVRERMRRVAGEVGSRVQNFGFLKHVSRPGPVGVFRLWVIKKIHRTRPTIGLRHPRTPSTARDNISGLGVFVFPSASSALVRLCRLSSGFCNDFILVKPRKSPRGEGGTHGQTSSRGSSPRARSRHFKMIFQNFTLRGLALMGAPIGAQGSWAHACM